MALAKGPPFRRLPSWGDFSKSMRLGTRDLIGGLLAVGFAVMIGYLAVTTSEGLRQLFVTSSHVDRLQEAISICKRGLGYFIIGNQYFLQPLRDCQADANDQLGQIRDLKGLSAAGLERHRIDRAVAAALSDVDKVVAAMEDGRLDEVGASLEMMRSKELMDAARESIAAFSDALAKATAELQTRQRYLHVTVTGVLVVLLAAAARLQAASQLSARRLAERLQLQRAIWSNAGDALFLYDVESHKIVDVNSQGCDLLGLPEEDIIGQDWKKFTPPHEIGRASMHIEKVGAKPQGAITGSLLRGDGKEVSVEATISAEIAMNGNRFAVSSFRNLTRREQALRDEAFRKAIEHTMPSGLAAINDMGEQTYVNKRVCEMLGFSQEELLGKHPPFAYWPPEEADRIKAVFQDALAGKIGSSGEEVTLMRKSGERFPAHILVARLTYARHPGWLAAVMDISDRKRTEAALEEVRRLEGIGQLAGQVAHDFNNLLTIITMNTAMIRLAHANDEDMARPLGAIADAAKRGASITRTLLSVARRQSLEPEAVELGAQLEELKLLFVATCGPGIVVTIDRPPSPLWVNVDLGSLSGALLNLVVNARDAMSGGGTLGLRLSSISLVDALSRPQCVLGSGTYAVIEVEDTGHGMSADVRRRAFEPFFSTKGRVGTGLGLAAVYGFARQSGGLAEIQSEPGRGTTVRVFIPVIKAPAQTAAPRKPDNAKTAAAYRVLCVDDEPDLLKALAQSLRLLGHSVTTAPDGETALTTFAAQEFDILLSDVLMPGMGGVALAEQAAKRDPRLAIALMTGFGMRPPEEGLPWEIIEKPFEPDAIESLFERVRSKSKTAD